jgi:hypothetical protein
MSLEVHKYIEVALEEKKKLYNAEVINFPKDKNFNKSKNISLENYNFWKLYDKLNPKENDDQLKAVTGICFMFVSLLLMGLYSTLL